MAMRSRIIGLEKLQKKLNAMPKLVKQEIRKALEQSAEEIVSLAKSLVPVDKGDLRDSIGWTYGDVPKGSISLGSVKASELTGDLTITVYAGNSQAFYARWQEFGTQKMQAQPFFYPAYRALRRRAKGRVTRATNKAAKKVAASR
ncbi:HK97-gp10 family putative phage morphogenesis protein [Brucella anthropi]|uniref:HK97-gp10 family putative phage morphogenesis protein n=1 Tax=Brucella anthropi TaxID=529 RepID=UPI0034E3CA3E